MKATTKRRLCLVAALFLLIALPAGAAPFEINPIDLDEPGLAYSYWLAGPRRMAMLPVTAGTRIHTDEPDVCVVIAALPEFEDVIFAIFAFESLGYAGRDLSQYTDAQVPEALNVISSWPGALKFKRYGEVAPGVTALWADERNDDTTAKHFVAFQGGWVYNVMTQREGESEIPAEALEAQERILLSLFQSIGEPTDSWDAGNGVTLEVPEPFMVSQPDVGDAEYSYAYVSPDETGPAVALCTVYALSSGMPVNAGLGDMSEDARMAMLQGAPLHPAEGIRPEEVEGHPGVMRYEASGKQVLFALRGGRLLMAVNVALDRSQDWTGDFALAALDAMLGAQPEWPARNLPDHASRKVDGALWVPVGDGVLRLAIPDGYEENVVMDEADGKMIGLEGDDGLVYILRVKSLGGSFQDLLAPDAPERAEVFAELSKAIEGIALMDVPQANLTSEYLVEGLLGVPGGHVFDAMGQYRMLYCPFGEYIVMLSVQAWEGDAGIPGLADLAGMLGVQ